MFQLIKLFGVNIFKRIILFRVFSQSKQDCLLFKVYLKQVFVSLSIIVFLLLEIFLSSEFCYRRLFKPVD